MLIGDSRRHDKDELLARAGEQVSAVGQDRRRAGHPDPPCLILRRHDLPLHLDIGPRREQRGEPGFQGFGTRALQASCKTKSLTVSAALAQRSCAPQSRSQKLTQRGKRINVPRSIVSTR